MCGGPDQYVRRPDPPPPPPSTGPRRERWSPWIAPFWRRLTARLA